MGSLTPLELGRLNQPCLSPVPNLLEPLPNLSPCLTLVVIWDVVRSFSVDKQGRQAQRLVGLISQADVVVSWVCKRES